MNRLATAFRNLRRNGAFLLMVLPGAAWFILFCYLPMPGAIFAFKEFRVDLGGGFFGAIFRSEWVGFKNFEFLFKAHDAYIITRNTVLYNLVFIVLGLVCSVAMALLLFQLTQKRLAKLYQTAMFMPYFLSWVIVSYFTFSFLSVDKGVVNQLLGTLGVQPIDWYSDPKYWPYILVFMNLWKGVGYSSVIYLAAIAGIDKTYYEAAMIDGASKWQQTLRITLPLIRPMMIILTILAVGGIFRANFGLFFQIPRDSGALFPVTNVIDTYVYRSLKVLGDFGMSTAAGLYQSVVGLILVLTTNKIVKKINEEQALF
ncbi:ABC transporter permease subunit [Paenibacillus sp. RUD330]|uniref:ABC transporter permease n=1 Tax=Paenibacillus sp. RUD330 TaxID=2023772 RepID=UPI000B92DD1C|nr:ABC transporter permease subunit [Paenibacillus sp. RUD330]ASS66931.1 sugar ABC transporter permease [Paenibacillus sp. RUD330]